LEHTNTRIHNCIKITSWSVNASILAEISKLRDRVVLFVKIKSACKNIKAKQGKDINKYHYWDQIIPNLSQAIYHNKNDISSLSKGKICIK